jgi:hypothetical protein
VPVYLAHHSPVAIDAECGHAVWSVVFGFSDYAHLTLRRTAWKLQRIANYESDLVLEQNARLLAALAQRGTLQIAGTLARNLVELASRGDNFYFAASSFPSLLRVPWQPVEICVRF